MELPECPPGAEGYEDSVVEVPKKLDDSQCTKAELEFQEHLQSLKIRLENNETRCMVERRERSISGKWTYLCYPCAAVCTGEAVLQNHLSGKKHKAKLGTRNVWPLSIFDDHPFNHMQKNAPASSQKLPSKTEEVVTIIEPEDRYKKFLEEKCHIQDEIDKIKAPLIGLEYLIENPPEQVHYEPTYLCTLCTKQGHPKTIINHMTCFWHRFNYLNRHFPKATNRLNPYKNQQKYREGLGVMMHRLSQRIEDKYGRMKPINIDKEVFEKEKDDILKWIFKRYHFVEKEGCTFEEVVDFDLMESLKIDDSKASKTTPASKKKDPTPPKVVAPSRANIRTRNERRISLSSLSDISDDDVKKPHLEGSDKHKHDPTKLSFETFSEQPMSFRSRYAIRHVQPEDKEKHSTSRPGNYEYKIKLVDERCKAIEDSAKKMLAYHEKNPEKHPLYPEEWKKFWNRRYKEIQAEGKDPSKHDFKPEWIAFWTKRMKELHEEDVRVQILEIYRKMNVSPPDLNKLKDSKEKARDKDTRGERDGKEKLRDRRDGRRSAERERRHSPERRRRSPGGMRLDSRRRSPDVRRRSPEARRRSPDVRLRSPDARRRSLDRKREPRKPFDDYRKRPSPSVRRPEMEHRSHRRSRSPPRKRTRSRSPRPSSKQPYSSPERVAASERRRSRSRSPLSRRAAELPLRNRSPVTHGVAPSMQTVLVSDDELKPEDDLSPWNSDNEIKSIASRSESVRSRPRAAAPAYRPPSPDHSSADHVIATLRTLVALEDYLGSLGPKIVDLLTEAITMEKDRANSSEDLLERESAVVLIETAKEKLKGAAQAGLVAPGAVHAVRAAVVRAAATLHEADLRAKDNAKKAPAAAASARVESQALPVAGVGEVDRALIARQMAAALIAQGKTDVTSEELAQLVDAVVGMAEAKKREAEANKKKEDRGPSRSAKSDDTTSALQLLQSAYDETEKKVPEKEEPTDAMDGLSDSDLETLLKNFNELSAEEQHSLIAYLKKLEARDPQRVEKLRQYVSAAATVAPKAEEPPPAKKSTPVDVKPVTIESDDDDDYTVEEVFKSATEKVKENQIRQEMEIVKKSLEENNVEKMNTPPPDLTRMIDLTKNLSSASDLFALVQASIQSTGATAATTDVPSATQPRSFGDATAPLPLATTLAPHPDLPQNSPFNGNFQNEQFQNNQGDSYQNEPYNQADSYDQNEPYDQNQPYDNTYNDQNDVYDDQGNFNNQNEPFNQGGYDNQNKQFDQGYGSQSGQFNEGGYDQNAPFNQGNTYEQNVPFNQNEQFQSNNFNQPWNSRPFNNMSDNRAPGMGAGYNNFNQFGGPRDNFRMQDNFNNKPKEINNHNKNFRGRNRGGRGNNRGRGRGRF